MLYLTTLGGLTLEEDGRPVLPGRRKPLALLLWLALRQGRPASREELATLLWGDSGETNARRSLRQCLSELRGAIGDRITEGDAGIAIAPGTLDLDLTRLRERVSAGMFEEALPMAAAEFVPAGDALGPEPWQEWLAAERAGLEEWRVRAFHGACTTAEDHADWRTLLGVAEQWRRAMPGDARAWAREVVALQSLGRLADASECIARARRHFVDTLGARLPEELARLARVLERLGDGATAPRTAVLTPELVGRGEAMARLSAARQQLRPGSIATGRRVLMPAVEGLGKTRLLREFARHTRAADRDLCVVHLVAVPDERTRPWALAAQLVTQLATHPALAGLPPEALATLATLAPELHEEFRQLPSAPVGDPAAVSAVVLKAVAEVAFSTGCVVLVDDVPQADDESLLILSALAQRPPSRCLLVAAGRPEEWEERAVLRTLLDRADAADRLSLAPLTPEESARAMASMVPLEASDLRRLTEVVSRLATGRPGLVASLVAGAGSTGALTRDPSGRWRLSTELAADALIGPDLRDRWRTRYEQAGEGQSIVDALAVLGRHGTQAAARALVESVSGVAPAAFATALDALQRSGIVTARDQGVELSTGAWQHLAAAALPGATARVMHHRAAVALATHPGRRHEAHLHRRSAGTDGRRRVLMTATALALIGAMSWLVLRPGRAATPVGTPLLLADIENMTGDTTFDRTLTLAASVGLQQSRQVTLFPRARVRETLGLMQRVGADTALHEALAREVAIRENLTRVAALSLSRIDSSYLLTARLIEPQTGADVFADRERAGSRAGVLAALDRLLTRVRRATGEPEDSLRRYAVPLPRVTTTSLPALRAFVSGQGAFTRREYAQATELFRRAVALDSSFAMAWLALSDSYFNTGNDPVRGRDALQHALALRDRLTEREQLRVDQSAAFRNGRRDEGLRLAELLAQRFPERDSWYSFGTLLMQARRCPDAIPALERAVSYDPRFASAHINIATCYQYVQRFDSALVAYAAAYGKDSSVLYSGSLNHEFGLALIRAGLLDSAERVFARMAAAPRPQDRGFGFRSRGYVAGLRGRYAEAAAMFDSAAMSSADAGADVSVFRSRVLQAEHLLGLGDQAGARRALDAAWSTAQRLNLAPSFALYAGLAFVRAGQLPRAQAMLKAIDRVAATETDRTERAILAARLALARRDPATARRTLAQATDTTRITYASGVLAEALEASGDVDSATAMYLRLSNAEVRGTEAQDLRFRALARAGDLAATHRGSAAAAVFDGVLLREWRAADPAHPYLTTALRRSRMRTPQDTARSHVVRP